QGTYRCVTAAESTRRGAGARPAEGMVMPLAAPLASEQALAGSDEGRGIGVPAACRRFEPGDDVVWCGRRLPRERAGEARRSRQQGSRGPSVWQPEDLARVSVAEDVR